jgi:hypothetical protein
MKASKTAVTRWVSAVGLVGAVTVAAAVVHAQEQDEQVRARQRISMMESVFERAVANGADNLVRQVKTYLPDPPMFLGAPRVRGFWLEGYGVFFDVEVPGLRPPVTWTLRYMLDDSRRGAAALAEFKAWLVQLGPRERARGQEVLTRLEAQMGAARAARLGSAGTVEVANPGPDGGPSGEPRVIVDPSEAYTNEVKSALVEAMFESSGTLTLQPDEWLTIAARDNVPSDPLVPSDKSDFSTVILRVKGSDLAAFRAGRLTLEQARERVEQREY